MDNAEAVRWYCLAAAQVFDMGHTKVTKAQFQLGFFWRSVKELRRTVQRLCDSTAL
jgi:hypothetical protein